MYGEHPCDQSMETGCTAGTDDQNDNGETVIFYMGRLTQFWHVKMLE